jgi:hypothetical protein
MRSSKLLAAALIAMLALGRPGPANAHSGGTNAQGCHTNHATGDYHCHTPREPASGYETYCHILRGERRCGYARNTCYQLTSEFGGFCQRE